PDSSQSNKLSNSTIPSTAGLEFWLDESAGSASHRYPTGGDNPWTNQRELALMRAPLLARQEDSTLPGPLLENPRLSSPSATRSSPLNLPHILRGEASYLRSWRDGAAEPSGTVLR